MKSFTFTLYARPVPINQKFFILRGRNILSKAYRDAKYDLALETRSQVNFSPLRGNLAVTLNQFYGDNRKRDIDAYIKIVLDAMEGIVYENDNQIVKLEATKAVDKDNPRIEVSVIEL